MLVHAEEASKHFSLIFTVSLLKRIKVCNFCVCVSEKAQANPLLSLDEGEVMSRNWQPTQMYCFHSCFIYAHFI